MLTNFAFLLGLTGTVGVIFIVLLLLIAAFEIAMFISAITNHRITDNSKILWIIGMLLLHPFVAIAYYFTDYQKRV